MLDETRARRERRWSRWTAGPLLAGSLGGALIVLSIMGAVQISASASRYPGESEIAVNRTLRGDRSIVTRKVPTI
jgi:hypothetical protein